MIVLLLMNCVSGVVYSWSYTELLKPLWGIIKVMFAFFLKDKNFIQEFIINSTTGNCTLSINELFPPFKLNKLNDTIGKENISWQLSQIYWIRLTKTCFAYLCYVSYFPSLEFEVRGAGSQTSWISFYYLFLLVAVPGEIAKSATWHIVRYDKGIFNFKKWKCSWNRYSKITFI